MGQSLGESSVGDQGVEGGENEQPEAKGSQSPGPFVAMRPERGESVLPE